MNNVYTVFEKFVKTINLYGTTPCSIINMPLGTHFRNDKLLYRFNEIIQNNLLVNDYNAILDNKTTDDIDGFSDELKDFIAMETRFEIFVLIYNRLFNVTTNDIIFSFKMVIPKLATFFSIDDQLLQSIETFFANQKTDDVKDSFYIVGHGFNPINSANGAKLNYGGKKDHIVYLKLISKFNSVLAKEVRVIKHYSQLTEELEIDGINIVNKGNFSEFIDCDLKFSELLKSMAKPVKTNCIEIQQTESFPFIKLDPIKGVITIEGVSTPISPLTYLEPILDWIDLYSATNKRLEINLTFQYYNTYTTKFLVRLIEKCNNLNSIGSSVLINWNYSQNDDEIKECGEFYKELFFNMPEFQLVSI